MAIATKEPKELTAEKPALTFKTAETLDTTKDYHYLMRAVNSPANPGTISPDQLDVDVSLWQQKGYDIHSIQFLGPYMPEGAGKVYGYIFGYHLVRG